VGTGVAGVGLGALLAKVISELAWPILVVGLLAHSVGMLGTRRATVGGGYRPNKWEQVTYWGCWAAIGIPLIVWILRRAN
jgi:hypothetical protein